MYLGIFCLGLLVSVFAFFLRALIRINNKVKNDFGCFTANQYYKYTVEILQFLYEDDNEEKVAQFFRKNTNMFIILDWLILTNTDSYEVIIKNGNHDGIFDVESEYCDQLRKYSRRFFNIYDENHKYIPINYKDTTFFTNFAELNVYKWAIESGLYDYINENKEEIEDLMVMDGILYDDETDDEAESSNTDNSDKEEEGGLQLDLTIRGKAIKVE